MKLIKTESALQAAYTIGDAEKSRCQNKIKTLLRILSGERVYKTSNDLADFLAKCGFETTDINPDQRTFTMSYRNINVTLCDSFTDETNYSIIIAIQDENT